MSVKMNPLNAAPKPKLSPAQRRVIDSLKRFSPDWLLFSQRTLDSLCFAGLITQDEGGWRLTEKGKSV